MKQAAAVLIVSFLVAGTSLAQTAEFDRVSGGEMKVVTKAATNKLSGSLGLSTSQSNAGFGSMKGFEGTLGGTILQDRLWFFAAGSRTEGLRFTPVSDITGPVTGPVTANALDAKVMSNLGERHDFSASFSSRDAAVADPLTIGDPVPTSFLSLRYTGMISNNASFNMSVSQQKSKTQ